MISQFWLLTLTVNGLSMWWCYVVEPLNSGIDYQQTGSAFHPVTTGFSHSNVVTAGNIGYSDVQQSNATATNAYQDYQGLLLIKFNIENQLLLLFFFVYLFYY